MNAVANKLLKTPAKYHLERQIVRVNDLAAGTQTTVVSNIHQGQLPKVFLISIACYYIS